MSFSRWRYKELLGHYGRLVGLHPYAMIFYPVILASLLTGLYFSKISIYNDLETLYGSRNGLYSSSSPLVDTLYATNYTHNFEEGRESKFRSYGSVMITAKDRGSILRPQIFRQIEELDRKVRSLELADQINNTWNFQDLCARNGKGCVLNHFFLLRPSIRDIERGVYRVKFPLQLDTSSWKIQFYGNVLGGVTLDTGRHIVAAHSVTLTYHLDPRFGDLVSRWEQVFLDAQGLTGPDISTKKLVSGSLIAEFGKDIVQVLPYFTIVAAVLVLGVGLANHRKGLVFFLAGFVSFVSSGLAVFSGYSFCQACGTRFIGINLIWPMATLVVALYDTLALLTSLQNTDPGLLVPERLSLAFRDAAIPSVILTGSFIATFGAAQHLVPLRAMSYFGLCGVVISAFGFLFQHTFTPGCVALLLQWRPARSSEHPAQQASFLKPDQQKLQNQTIKIPKEKISKTSSSYIPIMIASLMIALGLVSGWLAFTNKEGFESTDSFAYDNYVYKYYVDLIKDFYPHLFRFQLIIDSPLDYSDKKIQNQIEELFNRIESTEYIDEPYITESWLRYYKLFLHDRRSLFLLRGYDLSDPLGFNTCLRRVFFRLPPAKRFIPDIIFNDNATVIISSRFLFQCKDITSFEDLAKLFMKIERILKDYPFNIHIYHPYLRIIEVSGYMRDSFFIFVAGYVIILMLLNFIFTCSIRRTLFIGFFFIYHYIILLGFATLFGIKYSPILFICACFTFSITAASSVYITYYLRFLNSKKSFIKTMFQIPNVYICLFSIIGLVIVPFNISRICDSFLIFNLSSFAINSVLIYIFFILTKKYWIKLKFDQPQQNIYKASISSDDFTIITKDSKQNY